MTFTEQSAAIAKAIAEFPNEFGLFERAMGVVDHGPDPYADDAEYARYYLEMSITRCLGNEDWAVSE